MAEARRYRHVLTGLVGEFEKELAEVFKDVLVLVEGEQDAPAPVDQPANPAPDAAEGETTSEEEK